MRLQSALDTEINIAIQGFLDKGVARDVISLYYALQNSNSSLKRRPKKVLQGSIERVLQFRDAQQSSADANDSEAEIERNHVERPSVTDLMNRSLRSNLASPAPEASTQASTPGRTEDASRRQRMANGEPATKRQKSEKVVVTPPTDISLLDVGGIDDILKKLKELLVRPLLYPQMYINMNVQATRGILLHGPPGCGKTMITRAFAAQMALPFIEILGPSIVSSMSGESEKALRERFDEARKHAPCIVFLDELDAIAPKRESSQSQMEKRIVAQLLTCMDDLSKDPLKPVIVVAATNRPDSLDPALRRGGRFDSEICIGVPNERVREQILRTQTRNAPIAADVDFKKLAKMTAGFVGADLKDLVGKAASWQLSNYFDALEAQHSRLRSEAMNIDGQPHQQSKEAVNIMNLIDRSHNAHLPEPEGFEDKKITMQAFEAVLPEITPSSKREGFATVPNVSWEDIGALKSVREELQINVVDPIQNPEAYTALGLDSPTGVLLWGPPGCGKTLLAKAAAAESKANFIAVKGPELLNKFVGESEAAIRRVFARARSSVPCVIFFDELDALVPRREDGGSEVSNRMVNTLLTELDGTHDRSDIWVIGATNRPDVIDEAMLRPGRFGTPLFVDLPDKAGRVEIFKALVRNKKIEILPEILSVVEQCDGYSGADLQALIREAGYGAIQRKALTIEVQDFVRASVKLQGSVQNMDRYYALKERFGHRD